MQELKDFAVNLRPFSLNELCGQKLIVEEFKKRSLTNNFPNVMIFGGESGTGKTTTALIVGALINDNNPIVHKDYKDPNPESSESKSILSDSFNQNVLMFDASKMSKQDVVDLEQVASTNSLFGGKRVIIIEEAQALSSTAKGATLKLLEKKREDTYIILCTMNPESFDKAVRSRGAYYSFKSPNSIEIATYLYSLIEKYKFEVPDEFIEKGLFTISENSEGSVRMAVQTFERCLVAELYSEEAIQQEFGYVSIDKLGELIGGLIQRQSSVFKEIKNFDLKTFFYQSMKVISEAIIFHRTGIVNIEWKRRQLENLSKYIVDLEKLYDIYMEIDFKMGAYFRADYCLVKLTEFLKKVPENNKIKLQETSQRRTR